MAYNEKHLVKLADLKALGTKQKEVADALAARVDTLENVGSQANVLEGVKVNGTALAIAYMMVDILIASGEEKPQSAITPRTDGGSSSAEASRTVVAPIESPPRNSG